MSVTGSHTAATPLIIRTSFTQPGPCARDRFRYGARWPCDERGAAGASDGCRRALTPAPMGKARGMTRLKHSLGAALALAAIGATPGIATAKSYSPLDEYMLQSSIQGDRFEIAGGK